LSAIAVLRALTNVIPGGVYPFDFAQDKPERDWILPLHFVQGQNGNKRKVQNDRWMLLNNLPV